MRRNGTTLADALKHSDISDSTYWRYKKMMELEDEARGVSAPPTPKGTAIVPHASPILTKQQQNDTRYEQVKKLLEDTPGLSNREACEKVGIELAAFYSRRNKEAGTVNGNEPQPTKEFVIQC